MVVTRRAPGTTRRAGIAASPARAPPPAPGCRHRSASGAVQTRPTLRDAVSRRVDHGQPVVRPPSRQIILSLSWLWLSEPNSHENQAWWLAYFPASQVELRLPGWA